MEMDSNLVIAARKASGMTQEAAASICGISTDSYRSREKRPGDFRIRELELLSQSMEDPARNILIGAVDDIFLPR